MTETENRNPRAARRQNGGAMAEASTVEDVFDDTYREKDGPKPPRRLVWRNIALMSLLHAGALYGLVLLPSASGLTLGWSEYLPHTVAGLSWGRSVLFFPRPQQNVLMLCDLRWCLGCAGSGCVWQ